MKKILFVLLVLMFSQLNAQYMNSLANKSFVGGGMGVTWIDDKPYYSIRLFPEFALSNVGIGLDLNFEVDADGNLRKENFNDVTDFMSIIRYVRYGQKNDPVYARVGALDYATLGHGSIMYLYNNSPSYDKRRTGFAFDVDFNVAGFESVYSSLGEAGILGFRAYARPFKMMQQFSKIPIIKNFEVGATIVNDFHKYANTKALTLQDDGTWGAVDEKDMTIFGFDMGLPVITTSRLNLELYFDYTKIVDYGDGIATGFILSMNAGLADVRTKFERRVNSDKYMPAYFNSLYEIERFSINNTLGTINSKAQALENTINPGNGWYGELLVNLLGTFDVLGSYQRLDKDPQSGMLHLSTEVAPEGSNFVFRAGYDKVRIEDEKDIFTLDDRSYLFTELGYKPIPYMMVSMIYHWTFTPERDSDDNIVGYAPQKKIEPRISLMYPLN